MSAPPVEPTTTRSHVVYGIVRKSDRLLLYVGQSGQSKLGERLRQHQTTEASRWVRAGHDPADLDIVPLESARDSVDALCRETWTINELRAAGCELLNRPTQHPVKDILSGQVFPSIATAARWSGRPVAALTAEVKSRQLSLVGFQLAARPVS